ncbi:heterokaryon incompatibility protein 6 OR allele [Hyaloscypha variabilis]
MGLKQSKPSTAKSGLSELSADNKYQYSPLSDTDDSRLLHIQPGRKHDKIKCTLSPVSFASKPAYKALSYTWGTDGKTHTIECDGKLLPVTANLHSALQRFREKSQVCTIWVDAICINQENGPERSQQVRNMRRVYASASQAVIWLGDEIETDSEAFSFINAFEKALKSKRGFDWNNPRSFFGLHGVNYNTLWKSLGELLQRLWFGRLWIIQEVVMASNARVFCGSQTCSWESMSRMVRFIRQHGFHTNFGNPLGMNTVRVIAYLKDRLRQNRMAELDYLLLLKATRLFLSTDPRDRFFALHGFLSKDNTDGIQIDYELSYQQVCQNWAMHSIKKGSLKLLSLAERGPNSKLDLPSWIPDWSSAPEQVSRNPLFGLGFEAAGEAKAEVSILEDGRVLNVAGLTVDIIQRVGSYVLGSRKREPVDDKGLLSLPRDEIEWLKECDDIASAAEPYPTGEDFTEAYARMIVCNQKMTPARFQRGAEDSQDDPNDAFFREGYRCIRRSLERLPGINPETMLQYTKSINSVTTGRKFCATKRRYLGWVPGDAAPGDIICILLGAETPYILRPDENDSKYYKLVGETYIHGIMQGEALKWDRILRREFKIR